MDSYMLFLCQRKNKFEKIYQLLYTNPNLTAFPIYSSQKLERNDTCRLF